MKKVLGLDIGTNSIGAALINLPDKFEEYGSDGSIEWLGSRIIPLDGDYLQKFESGTQAETKAAFRRGKRGSRRLKHRYKLRRTRLIKVLKVIGWLDESFPLDDSKKFKQDVNTNGYSLKISDYLPFSPTTIEEFERELGIAGQKSKKHKSTVPEDWIIYYLRKKALDQMITFQELARIIYILNQRRGFKSGRKDLKEVDTLSYEEFESIKNNLTLQEHQNRDLETKFVSITTVVSIKKVTNEPDKKGNFKFLIEVADGRVQDFEISRKKEPEWKGKEFTFLIEQKIKKGKFEQLQPKTPSENDWNLCTTALDEKINAYRTPGEYFYEQIKESYKTQNNFKVRQFAVHRKRYQEELSAIWSKQCELNPELKKLNSNPDLLIQIAEVLYPTQAKHNMSKMAEFKSHDLLHIINNDIIYYQRELKSQKNSIGECRYEKRVGKRKNENGEWEESGKYGLKCTPRSAPLFQEFRIWQDIHNLRLLEREVKEANSTKLDVDVTSSFINEQVKQSLFELFNSKASVSERDILTLIKENYPDSNIKLDVDKKEKTHSHRINLFARKSELKGNETLSRYRLLFKKVDFDGGQVLSDPDKLVHLWHIDYSITSSDEEKFRKGITTALNKLLPDSKNKEKVIELFTRLPELKKEYASYSACAIKKLLPVMRCGKYWREEDITNEVNKRADQIQDRLNSINHNIRRLNEITDDDLQKQVLKSLIGKEHLTKGLNTYQACYLIYDRHSEKENYQVGTVEEFNKFIQKEIPHNSLRNPVVEQVVRETMFLVRDIWKKYGSINEIHIELGRSLKNNQQDREKISDAQNKNFEEKKRIKALLYELINNGIEQYTDDNKIESANFEVNPNPESPADIDKFRIWRSLNKHPDFEWAKKVKDEKIPTDQEVKKYALWISQNCRSPYTGKIIPLSKLFDETQYQIEHIIPRAKMKNDGFNNLVISESAINPKPYKGSLLARNFIEQFGGKEGKEYEIHGKKYFILGEEQYEALCKDTFKFQKAKLKNLLATEIPDNFIERQLNDTRYIGKKLAELLKPVTKNENGIIFTGGAITSELKNNWGLNKVWKELMTPRFERLEKITGNKYIIHEKDDRGNPVVHFNVKENEQLDLKRIDHRHHALDALIIAVTTREHIRYLNTLSAADTDEEIKNFKRTLVKGKIREFKEPWADFTKDVKNKLEETIVTFKTNNKIVSVPKNRTAYFKVIDGRIKRDFKEQKSSKKWMAVRKSMFKEPLGVIWLKETKEASVYDAFKIHIEKKLADHDYEKRKTASYVYDKQARQIIDDIVNKSNFSIDELDYLLKDIKIFLERNSQKIATNKVNKKGKAENKIIYKLNGVEYEKIKVAHFVSYKTKRMALSKKEYAESLTVEKMRKDFPYFSFINRTFYDSLPERLKTIITNAGLEISENRKPNAFNQLFLEHILEYDNNAKEAFSAEGIEKLNKKAVENRKIGKEIKSVTRLDGTVNIEDMFNGGYYETDKGSNVYFVMYENQVTKKREGFHSIATHQAIEKIVKGRPFAEERDGFNKITLSPGDLVYVPTAEETERLGNGISAGQAINWTDKRKLSERIYKVNDFSKSTLYLVPGRLANTIIEKEIHNSAGAKSEYLINTSKHQGIEEHPVSIKKVCIKIKIDRLGNISKI